MPYNAPPPLSEGEELFALHCRVYGLSPVRQFQFCATRKWRADFAFPDHRLIVEIDGAVHRIKGRFNADVERHNWLALNGWTHLRYTRKMVEAGTAINRVVEWLNRSNSV